MIHLKVGDILEMVIRDNTIIFKPKVILDRESVKAAIKEGRVHGHFKNVEEFEAGVKKFRKTTEIYTHLSKKAIGDIKKCIE